MLGRRKPPRASLLVPKSSGSLWGSESPFCCGTQGSFCCDSPQGVRGTWLGHEPCSSKGQAETRPRDFSGVPGPNASTAHSSQPTSPRGGSEGQVEGAALFPTLQPRNWRRGITKAEAGPALYLSRGPDPSPQLPRQTEKGRFGNLGSFPSGPQTHTACVELRKCAGLWSPAEPTPA